MVNFHVEKTGTVDKGRAVDILYLLFPRVNFTPSSSFSSHQLAQGDGEWGCGQSIIACLSHFFLILNYSSLCLDMRVKI